MESKKFYWLKLKRDFFKRHDIRIIEGMENGIEISHFYIKLMLESVDHDGELRFSEDIPYTPEMLSVITFTKLEIVKQGLGVLESFGLLEQTEDGTLKLPKVTNLIDSASDSDGARRMRRLRDERKTNEAFADTNKKRTNCSDVRTNSDEIKSKRQIKIKSKSKSYIFTPPTLEEVIAYCEERGNNVDPERWFNYYTSNGWKVGKNPMKDWKAAVRTWERDSKPQGIPQKKEETFVDLLERWESEEDG